MIRFEDECLDCPQGCAGREGCPYANVLHAYCDECSEEGEIYEFDGRELCLDCITEILDGDSDQYGECKMCGELTRLYDFEGSALCLDCIMDRLKMDGTVAENVAFKEY